MSDAPLYMSHTTNLFLSENGTLSYTRDMNVTRTAIAAGLLAIAYTPQISAKSPQIVSESGQVLPTYSEIAALVVKSNVVIDATVRSATRISGPEAASAPPNHVRFYVESDITALIRGPGAMPPRIGYVLDIPLDYRGRTPRLRKQRILLFGRTLSSAGQIQLSGLGGQRNWSAELDAMTRKIAQEAVSPTAPPAITGIGNAFHVPGTLPGEGETQIFLTTATGAPVSLLILRRPNEQRRWAVSLGEIVDDAAGPPQRDTLLWYRLTCGLPRTLPDSAVAAEEPANAAIAREDYSFVLDSVGTCRN